MMTGKKQDHIGVACSDVEANVKWYKDVLGFQIRGRFIDGGSGHNVYFLVNPYDQTVYEMYQIDDLSAFAPGKVDHVAYTSLNLKKDYEECMNKGYKIVTKGIESCESFWGCGVDYFKIESPCGEQIEFCQIRQ